MVNAQIILENNQADFHNVFGFPLVDTAETKVSVGHTVQIIRF